MAGSEEESGGYSGGTCPDREIRTQVVDEWQGMAEAVEIHVGNSTPCPDCPLNFLSNTSTSFIKRTGLWLHPNGKYSSITPKPTASHPPSVTVRIVIIAVISETFRHPTLVPVFECWGQIPGQATEAALFYTGWVVKIGDGKGRKDAIDPTTWR